MKNPAPHASLLVGTVIITVIVGVSVWMARTRDDSDPNAATARTTTPSRAEVVSAPRSIRPAPAPAPDLSAEDFLATMAANEAAATKLIAAGKQKLVDRYEGEPVDPAWASRKQRTLESLQTSPQIDQVNAHPLSFNVQCRTSVCQISAEFPSRVAAEDWFTLYTLNAGGEMFNASSDRTINPDGTARLQIYGLARQ